MALLQLTNLVKRYGSMTVVDNVSLEIGEGEALGVIGPNGAGKTTLFNLIAGTVRNSAGKLVFDGTDITGVPARRRCRMGIARSFQIPHPFEGMTTYENVLIGAAFGRDLSEKAAFQKTMETLEITGILPKSNVLAGSLTLLERKRLELARALATGPKLLLLDEIAGGLTEAECHELVDMINAIRRNGVTIVWIEHVVHALLAVVDRLAVIDFGKKIAEGDPHTVMHSPEVEAIYLGIEGEVDDE